MRLRVRQLFEGQRLEIDTPNLAFVISQPGDYRIDANPATNTTRVVAQSGAGVLYGDSGAPVNLGNQQQGNFTGTNLTPAAPGSAELDSFDNWAMARDQREDQSVSARYVPRETVGYQQLDNYGDWSQDPSYGPVWLPRAVPANWAPYRARPLELDSALGLDLGRRRTVGLCALPLRALGTNRPALGLGARPPATTARVRACARGVCGGQQRRRELEHFPRLRRTAAPRSRLVSAGAGRSLQACVPREPALCHPSEQQHRGEQHHQRHQRLPLPAPACGRHRRQPPATSPAAGPGASAFLGVHAALPVLRTMVPHLGTTFALPPSGCQFRRACTALPDSCRGDAARIDAPVAPVQPGAATQVPKWLDPPARASTTLTAQVNHPTAGQRRHRGCANGCACAAACLACVHSGSTCLTRSTCGCGCR